MSRPIGLLLAGAAAIVAVVAATISVPAAAQTDPAGAGRAEVAASWLSDQLVDGERLQVAFGSDRFDDPGLTIDAVIAFAAAGAVDGFAAGATAWLETSATTDLYVGDGTTESYAGALAKLSLLAQVRGLDPTSWGEGSVDLIARLASQEQPDGRFTDVSGFGDFSNSIGQSLAVIVLVRQPSAAPSDASIDLLLQSQCDDGGFSLTLAPAAGSCVSGVDTSAYALQALLAAGRADDTDEIVGVIAYLASVQAGNGGFGTDAVETPNANSTGLAVQALRVADEGSIADAGVAFLEAQQVDCAASEQRGAVAFDAAGFDPGTAPRATAQAILGLTGVGYATVSSAGASPEVPRFECVAASSSSSSSTSTTSTTATSTTATSTSTTGVVVLGSSQQTQAAVPVSANPTFTG